MRQLIRITDPDDPAIVEFTNIRERDLTRSGGRFIAEGTVVLRMLAAAHHAGTRFKAHKILLLENRVDGLDDILSAFPPDVPVYVASGDVLDRIAGFHLHRGVLALGERLEPPPLNEVLNGLPQRALVVVCQGLANHDNAGSIFRNAAAFGVSHIILDETSCDPLYRKAIRVSVGSVLTVPYARGGNIEALLQTLKDNGFAFWGLSPAGKTSIRALPNSERTALILGTEGEGLPPHLLASIKTARIPQMPGLDSLNVATAAGIALYETAHAMGLLPDL
nr:RNA methyltransferase [Rhizobium sp. L1K21]